jgi:hypothetical protein
MSATLTFDERDDIGASIVDLHTVDRAELAATAELAGMLGLPARDARMILTQARRENGIRFSEADVHELETMIQQYHDDRAGERGELDPRAAHRLAEYEADPDGQERRWRADDRD